jgi:hypothetical protein
LLARRELLFLVVSRLKKCREAVSALPKAGVQPVGRNDKSIAIVFSPNSPAKSHVKPSFGLS